MFNVVFNNSYKIVNFKGILIPLHFKISYKFIAMTVTGRIFRWVKGRYYMKFILPVSNKPSMFLKTHYVALPSANYTTFIWFSDTSKHFFLKNLIKIKKPSIFNNRGFHILNKVLYKKRGKVTSYVTNK